MVNILCFTWLSLLPPGFLTKSEFIWKDWMQMVQLFLHMMSIKNISFFVVKILFYYKNIFLNSYIAEKTVNRKLRFHLASEQSVLRRHGCLCSSIQFLNLDWKRSEVCIWTKFLTNNFFYTYKVLHWEWLCFISRYNLAWKVIQRVGWAE